jgi:hypothetical protein
MLISECLSIGIAFATLKVAAIFFAMQSPCAALTEIPYLFRDYVGPPLLSSGQSSWLQIQRSGFDSQRYQIFWKVVGLERGPLSLVSTTEELLGRKSSGSGLEI